MPGFRQRLEASARSRSPPVEQHRGIAQLPAQVKSWLSSWAWGRCPAAEVIRDAAAAAHDIPRQDLHPAIRRLAQCSSNLGNAERVVESMAPDLGLCQPVRVADSSIEYVLPPDKLLAWLSSTSPSRFALHLRGADGDVEAFWQSFLSRPCCQEFRHLHPWLRGRSPSDLRHHLPLMIFDDAGPISATGSTFARCWYSLLGRGGEKECRFLICTGIKDGVGEDMSWPVILESFRQLAQPIEPGKWGGILLCLVVICSIAATCLDCPTTTRQRTCAQIAWPTPPIGHTTVSGQLQLGATQWSTTKPTCRGCGHPFTL